MEKIDEQLDSLSSTEIPFGLHQSVMRKINYQKIKPVLLVAFALLVFNFLAIAWHINAKLIDADFLNMTSDFFDVFSFNLSFVNTIATSFFEIISLPIFLSAFFSLIGAVYVGKKIKIYHFA